ncbi:ligand-binding sensor domain-containing protein [Chitinophagaceae bacterium MMS25-I14]
MRALIPLLTLYILLFTCHSSLHAQQQKDYIIHHYTTDDGLPQNNASKIIQDENGFVWIATLNGLARLDGHSIKTFDESNLSPLTSSTIVDVKTAGPYTCLYTTEEIAWMYHGKILLRYRLPEKVERFQPIQNFEKQVNFTVLLNRKLFLFSNGKLLQDKIPGYSFYGFHTCDDANIFLCTDDNRLYLYKRTEHKLLFVDSTLDWNIQGDSENLYYWNRKRELIATTKTTPETRRKLYKATAPRRSTGIFPSGFAFTDADTLIYFTNPLSAYNKIPLSVLGTVNVRSFCIATNGNIWIGTSDKGVFMLSPGIIHQYDPQGAPLFQEIYFVKIIDSTLFTGSRDGLCAMNLRTGTYKPAGTFYKKGNIWDVAIFNGTMFAATFGGGILTYRNGITNVISSPALPSNNVFCLMPSAGKLLWIGTEKGTVCMDTTGALKKPEIPGYSNLTPYYFAEALSGEVYIATDEGIFVINKKLCVIKHITINDGLPCNKVRSMYIDKARQVWIGTLKGGLCLLSNDHIYNFPTGPGGLNRDVLSITEDRNGFLWMTANEGLYKVKKNDLEAYASASKTLFSVQHYSVADGLRNPEFNSHTQGKACIDSAGRLWFPNINGLASVTPSQNLTIDYKHDIRIDEVTVDDSTFFAWNNEVQIPSPINRIHVNYALAAFTDSESPLFEYKFEDADQDWIFNGEKREIDLTNIPEGFKTLLIRQFNKPQTTVYLDFNVTAPFLLSRTFKSLLILIGICIIILASGLYQKNINWKNYKKIEAEKEVLSLRVIALQKQVSPHFIFNGLHTLQTIFFEKKFILANEYLANFSSLLRFSLEYARQDSASLKEELMLVCNYLELEKLQFAANEFSYSIDIESAITVSQISIPAFLLQPFVENALKHGFRQLHQYQKKIHIRIHREHNNVVLYVEDNGRGFPAKNASADTQQHQSRGMDIIRTKILLFNKIYKRNISFSAETLNTNTEGLPGTRITIYL